MTRAYFRSQPAVFRASQDNALQRLQEFIIDEHAVIAPQVTHLEVELSPGRFKNSIFKLEREGEENIRGAPNIRTFVPKLEDAVAKLPKLERLAINVNGLCRSDKPVSDNGDDDEEEMDVQRPHLDLDLLDLIRSTLSSIFSSPSTELRMLTNLRLTLFSTYDIATIGSHISDTVACQLQRLHLEYTDGTGPGGDREYTRYSDGWGGDDEDGDENMPYSNLQRRYKNTEYMPAVCAFVSRCHNLKTLGIEGTQCFDLASLDWKPRNGGLEGIYLSRAVATASQLVSLLSPSPSSPTSTSNIKAFQIDEVQLFDETWADVFDHLASCPHLNYIHVYNLVYAKAGESAHHRRSNNRPWENVSVIWSENNKDQSSLRRVVREVEGRGGSSSVDVDDLDSSDDEDGGCTVFD
jgi:hypothetical protein